MSHNPWTQRRPVDFISLIKMPTIMGPNISTQHLLFFSLQNNTGGTGAPQWRRQERPFWQMKCLEAAEVPPADIEYSRVCSSKRPIMWHDIDQTQSATIFVSFLYLYLFLILYFFNHFRISCNLGGKKSAKYLDILLMG